MEIFLQIALPVGILILMGLVVGLLLTFSAKTLSVPVDERIDAVRQVLPGANCGACGCAGCDEYAEKAAKGELAVGLCIPGGAEVTAKMSELLGREEVKAVSKKALLACHGCRESDPALTYEYIGPKSCKAANSFYGGDRGCKYSCLGYGDCVSACEFSALEIRNGLPFVNTALCVGCGKCEKTCPRKTITLIPETQKVAVACSNRDFGKKVMNVCKVGCIGCGKCEKTCPKDAIKIVDHLAVIDAEGCAGCGLCAEACPTGAILKR